MSGGRALLWIAAFSLVAAGAYWIGRGQGYDKELKESLDASVATSTSDATIAMVGNASTAPRAEGVTGHPPSSQDVQFTENGGAPVPARFQFDGISHVQTGVDFEDWMSRYPKSAREALLSFNKRHFGVYESRTPEAIAWMAKNGYPMPEDVIAAQAYSTQLLRSKADGGNIKASYLLKDRYLTEIARLMDSQGKTFGEVVLDNPHITDGLALFQKSIWGSESPYKAYLAARSAAVSTSDPDGRDAQVMAALLWARSLGDLGAKSILFDFVGSNPDRQQLRSNYQLAVLAAYHYLETMDSFGSSECARRGLGHSTSYPIQDR